MVKQVEYKTYGPDNQYDELSSSQYCEECKRVYETPVGETIDTVDNYISEANILCPQCGAFINFWCHGNFEKDEYGVWA